MNRQEAFEHLRASARVLADALDDRFLTFIAYGSVMQDHYSPRESDLNGALVIADETEINDVRTAFMPLWAAHGEALRRPPLVISHASFPRVCRQFPTLAAHWRETGRQLGGRLDFPPIPPPLPGVERAETADQLLRASSLLAAGMLSSERRAEALRCDQRLRRRFKLEAGRLAELVRLFDPDPPGPALPAHEPPYEIPGLVSIYESLGDVYFLLREAADIPAADWPAIGADLARRGYTALLVGTTGQFRLALSSCYPLDVRLRGYQHTWGIDLLDDLDLPTAAVLEHAGRIAASLEIDQFPYALLTQPPEEQTDRSLIHDFQNKLLNVRLQNDLLSRLKLSEPGQPPPLPDRHSPHAVRLQAIWTQFAWWADFYDRAVRALQPPS